MDAALQREELTRLISRLLDEDTLSAEERTRLNECLIADPEARQLYRQYVDMQIEFACLTEPEAISEQQIAEIVREHAAPLAAASADPQEGHWSREAIKTPRKRWPEFAAAAAAALVLISFAIKNIQRPSSPPLVGVVENAQGEVKFGSPDETGDATPGVQVRADQTLTTSGGKSSAVFLFEDGTSLVVAGDTQIETVDGAKRVKVSAGAVAASVSPQPPGKPLVVSTPIADIEVVGTRFSVNHHGDLTDLAVTQGSVVLRRRSDGSTLEVSAGRRVFAEAHGILRLENLPTLASSWRADFEDGQRHPYCQVGEPTTDGLPGSSQGGLRAGRVKEPSTPGGHSGQILFGSPWAEGLLIAREKTHLHLRYKLDKPGPLHIQIETRTDGPKPQLANYQFNQFPTQPPGQWIDAQIPLQQFENTADPSDRTMAGEIPLNLLIVAPFDHSGLTIDDLRLDSSGNGQFETLPVQ